MASQISDFTAFPSPEGVLMVPPPEDGFLSHPVPGQGLLCPHEAGAPGGHVLSPTPASGDEASCPSSACGPPCRALELVDRTGHSSPGCTEGLSPGARGPADPGPSETLSLLLILTHRHASIAV